MHELEKGWLSPTGEFIRTGLYEHLAVARNIAKQIGIVEKFHVDDALISLGWVSITLGEIFREWRIVWRSPLTPEQMKFLEPYFYDYYPVDEIVKWHWDMECGNCGNIEN